MFSKWRNKIIIIGFDNIDTEELLLFKSVGYSLQQGYEAHSHVNAFEQSSAPLPTAGHTT